MHKDENPIAAGNYDDTFRDDPDREIRCPHCGAIWEMRQITPNQTFPDERPQYDWTSGKHTLSSHDSNFTPISKYFCYACALETAPDALLIEFVREHAEDFRDWRTFENERRYHEHNQSNHHRRR